MAIYMVSTEHNLVVGASGETNIAMTMQIGPDENDLPSGWTIDDIADLIRDALVTGIPNMTHSTLAKSVVSRENTTL